MLVEGSDYDLLYTAEGDDYKSVGNHFIEVRFKGYYSGEVFTRLFHSSAEIEEGNPKFAVSFPVLYYNGTAQKAKPELAYDDWKLAENIDYTLTYSENGDDYTSVGEHEVVLSFCGNYTGTVVQRYAIHAQTAENMGKDLKIYVPSLYFSKRHSFPDQKSFMERRN